MSCFAWLQRHFLARSDPGHNPDKRHAFFWGDVPGLDRDDFA
jgi:hypothetical protein